MLVATSVALDAAEANSAALGNDPLLAHWIALAWSPLSLKYFKAPG